MKMFFTGAGVLGISHGSPPTEEKALAAWKQQDSQMVAFIYVKVDDEYQYLIEDMESGVEAWKKLKGHFERSTMGQCIAAREAFYTISHDPSRPITTYIQALLSARKKMEALGCKVEDTEFKDVMLMHLDSSFSAVRTIVLAKVDEPSLEEVKAILSSSSTGDSVSGKAESQEVAFAARGRGNGLGLGPGQGQGQGIQDGEYQWCNPSNPTGCHRCG